MPANDFRRVVAALQRFGLSVGDAPVWDAADLARRVEVAARNWHAGRVRLRAGVWRELGKAIPVRMSVRAWDEAKHTRGWPGNAGEFASKGGAATAKPPPAPEPAR